MANSRQRAVRISIALLCLGVASALAACKTDGVPEFPSESVVGPVGSSERSISEQAPAKPKLNVKTSIQDQDGDRCLTPFEQVVLHIEIENAGTVSAKGVEIHLSGHPVLVKTLGRKKLVGRIVPHWKKDVVMTGLLPEEPPSGRTVLRVEVRDAQGQASPVSTDLRVAIGSNFCGTGTQSPKEGSGR